MHLSEEPGNRKLLIYKLKLVERRRIAFASIRLF